MISEWDEQKVWMAVTELTIDQTLKSGIVSHKAGQVHEADHLYTAILKTQPKHPYASHNMGILTVDVGKVEFRSESLIKTTV